MKRLDKAFDNAVDGWWERRLRGRRFVDRLFYGASEAANHSILWHSLGIVTALVAWSPWPAVQLSVALGLESALVNGAIKSLFRRRRPESSQPRPFSLRQPRTSSFPSGHASAAMLAAALLSRDEFSAVLGSLWPLWYGLAIMVSLSRIHTRIHHASDVVAGAGLGVLLGWLARWILS